MLNYNNERDRTKMMNYHRTKDMINLLLYFPNLSPIKNLTIVENVDDYLMNKDFCDKLTSVRNDTLISKPSMKSIENDGINFDIANMINRIKEVDKDGVIVLFNLLGNSSERYQRYAGISVGVSVGRGVYIDAVSKGFDGREVSKGISTHERYYIPWFELSKCSVDNFKSYRTYLISGDEYEISRGERVVFLKSIGVSTNLDEHIPLKYEEIPDFIWQDVIKNLIKQLVKKEDEIESAGLYEFAISGHTEGKYFMPWQLFDKGRYVSSKTK